MRFQYMDQLWRNDIKELFLFLQEKMIIDISYEVIDYKTKYGIQEHNIVFEIVTYYTGKYYFIIPELVTFNKDSLLQIIHEEFEGITGNKKEALEITG